MSDYTWDDLAESIDFEAVLEELGITVLEVKKGEHWASCPLDTHPGADRSGTNFSINEDSYKWNCFVCDEGGSLPGLVMRMEGLDHDEALDWLLPYTDYSDDVDVAWQESIRMALQRSESAPKRTRGSTLPSYSPSVLEGLKTAPRSLLEKWQIDDRHTIELFGLKYDPERLRMSKKDGHYSGPALIIPHWFGGDMVGYQERWIGDDVPKWIPKYTNSTGFPRAETIYNWDRVLDFAREGLSIIVVESVMTVIRLWQIGYPAISTFGAQINPAQMRLIRSLPRLILALDSSDPFYRNKKGNLVMGAGRKATRKAIEELTDYTYVEVMPPIAMDKGDLADLSDDEIACQIQASKPLLTPNSV